MKFLAKDQQGFSLVELMIVVAIIGVLAALAVPKFASFQAKARQAEAKSNLSHIYTLEEAFYGDNEQYTNMAAVGYAAGGACLSPVNALGFAVRPCAAAATPTNKTRYTYTVAGASQTAFTGTATSGTGANNKIIPSCATADTWSVNENKRLSHDSNAIALCN